MAYTFKHGDRPLDGITIQRAVGRGGFGEVYYALTDSGKQIALKYLRENPEVELRGISHVMNLKSPHLITIYDVKHDAAGEPFVLMEYVSGPSLRELMLAEPQGLGPQKTAFFLDGIAKGLAYLHDRGIVHRDLKPANIFYDDGYVKIGDYGLSKHIAVSKHSGQTVSVGTVHYMAPEIGSGSYTKAIDIYALGVILFELLTGRLPFTGSSMGEVLMRHLSERPDLAGIPEPFASVIAKALAKDPKDRYQDVNEMLDVIRQHTEISASLSTFDPATLTRAPRDPLAVDPEQTLTTPPRAAVPALDVRQAAMQQGLPEPIAERLQRKANRIAQKIERGADRLRRGAEHIASVRSVSTPETPILPGSRRKQIFVIIAVAVGVGVALSAVHGGSRVSQQSVALALCILACTFGPLLAHFRFLLRAPARTVLWDKFTYAAITALLMAPAFANASQVSSALVRTMLTPLIVLVLCDWTKRIEEGRRGKIKGGDAIWPAIIGLIVAGMAHAGDYQWVAAGVCAAMSLLAQAGAALWPPQRAAVAPPAAMGGGFPPTDAVSAGAAAGDRATGQPRVGGMATFAVEEPRVPRSATIRNVFRVLSVLAGAVSASSFFALVIGQPTDDESKAALFFFTLAGLAWLPFLICKGTQVYKMPAWRGTLRMLSFSAALCLAGGMITALAFGGLEQDDRAAAIFFLVFSSVTALVVLCIPGCAKLPAQCCSTAKVVAIPASALTAPASPTAERPDAPAAVPPVPAQAVSPETPAPPLVIDAGQPSFVGRATNAGLSFIGKMLLLAAIVLGAGHQALREQIESALQRNGVRAPTEAQHLLQAGIPGPALLGMAVLGCASLLLARRGSGSAHVLRGCAGCVFGLWGLVMALGPSAAALQELFHAPDWSKLAWPNVAGPLAVVAIPLTLSFLLLTWPQRRENTVVI